MQGVYLKFYVQENHRHHGKLAYEWLLEDARRAGVHGGSAFRAAAGFGRQGKLHEDHFFELAGEVPVEVGFVLSEAEAAAMLERVSSEGMSLYYVKIPVEYGVTAPRG
jgi:PII-like signaling protein